MSSVSALPVIGRRGFEAAARTRLREGLGYGLALFTVLAVSMALRTILVLRGGQLFWTDENRYLRAIELWRNLGAGHWGRALDALVAFPDHPGFTAMAALPALLQILVASVLGPLPAPPGVAPDPVASYLGERLVETLWIPALLLSTASVACILLTERLARKAGAGPGEALVAAALMAAANTMFFYSSHLLPYDTSLALMLLALWLGLGPQAGGRRLLASGLVLGLGLVTYLGYWSGALVVSGAIAAFQIHSLRAILCRGALTGAAALVPVSLLLLANLARGRWWLSLAGQFTTMQQGAFDVSWRLPFAYLWHAEHGVALLWAAGAAAAALLVLRKGFTPGARAVLWLAMAVAVYLLLVLASTGMHKFDIYGRQVHFATPFLCLATAYALSQAAPALRARGWLVPLALPAAVALSVQAGFNFAQPIAQQYPRDIERSIVSRYGPVGYFVTLTGPWVPAPEIAGHRYVLVNATEVEVPVWGSTRAPAGRIVFRTSNPIQFEPAQYEYLSPAERDIIRKNDPAIELIDTEGS